MLAGVLSEATVAALRTPFLHESVNAAPGTGLPVGTAAKVGNATPWRNKSAASEVMSKMPPPIGSR
jgi:hypothetical protein